VMMSTKKRDDCYQDVAELHPALWFGAGFVVEKCPSLRRGFGTNHHQQD